MNKEDRKSRIIQLLKESDGSQILGTRDLSEHLGVSEMTVRRDLEELSKEGLILRTHGGAGRVRQQQDQSVREIGILLVSQTTKYSDPFFNAVIQGADNKIQELGYRIAYINTQVEVNTAAQARDLLKSRKVYGMILVGPSLGTECVEYLKIHVPALVNTVGSIGPDFDSIMFDGYGGMRQVVAHLAKRGYKRLGFISGLVFGQFDSRQSGFSDECLNQGLPVQPELCISIPSGIEGWTPQMGRLGAEQLMGLSNPPDAIVCASDLIAIGAIQWLHQNQFRVPEDVAVTGFDNITESEFTVPSLTTVNVHKQLIGALAAERVVKRIENEQEVPLCIQTPTRLVVRHSCGTQ